MYSLRHLLSVRYWFSEPPFLGAPALWSMVIIFVLLLSGAVVSRFFAKKKEKSLGRGLSKLSACLGWMGASAFILLFFRYEFVPFLSRRFMFGLWFGGFLIWLVLILRYFLFRAPRLRQAAEKREKLKKYLP